MTVKDKVVIITGASSGIGAATSKLLAKNGAKLILGARREDRLQELSAQIKEDGGQVFYKKTDVADKDQVKALADLALEKFGRIDVLYNNAGTMPQGNLRDLDFDKWKQTLDVNILGVLNGIGAVLSTMEKQSDGLIIATDSVAGHVVYPASAVYNGSKFAVRAIMEGLRQEEKDYGIRSTIVSPGAVRTELINSIGNKDVEDSVRPLFEASDESGLSLSADDVARAVLYAVDQPKHVAVSEVLIRPTKQVV